MNITDKFKNMFLYGSKYKTNSEAVIIACYFNPQKNPYRTKAFANWYNSIKHLNHRIIECVIGDSTPELDIYNSPFISTIHTPNLLWHKESLLNKVVSELPENFKYVFWLDTDVIFTNLNWLVESVEVLKTQYMVQPFEYCIHLDQNELSPSFDVNSQKPLVGHPKYRHPKMWKSFGANHICGNSDNSNYDSHGHVGFAWGARREVLDAVPLYDHALVGGADHIIAHAAAGHIGHPCLAKSFTEDLEAVNKWSRKFNSIVKGKVGYVKGDLYHIWHGDVDKRQYLKRVQEFTPKSKHITERDENGLHITNDDSYVKKYFDEREVKHVEEFVTHAPKKKKTNSYTKQEKMTYLRSQYPDRDDDFLESMIYGYVFDSTIMGTVLGGNVSGAIIGDMLADSNNQQFNDDNNFQTNDNPTGEPFTGSDLSASDNIDSGNFS